MNTRLKGFGCFLTNFGFIYFKVLGFLFLLGCGVGGGSCVFKVQAGMEGSGSAQQPHCRLIKGTTKLQRPRAGPQHSLATAGHGHRRSPSAQSPGEPP